MKIPFAFFYRFRQNRNLFLINNVYNIDPVVTVDFYEDVDMVPIGY